MIKEAFLKLQHDRPLAVLSDLVYDALFNEIITIKLPPRTRLNEAQLASELGISRSPVNTAFQRLIDEQLLVKECNKAPCVAPVDPEDCLQICHARIGIEGYAAYLAAKKATDAELARLATLIAQYRQSIGGDDWLSAPQIDHKIHTLIVQASHNPYLIEMYKTVQSRILRYRCYLEYLMEKDDLRERMASQSKNHEAILHALTSGLSDAARAETALDIDAMRDVFVKSRRNLSDRIRR